MASEAWFFRGTRVPVAVFFENLVDDASVHEFVEWFAGVAAAQARAVQWCWLKFECYECGLRLIKTCPYRYTWKNEFMKKVNAAPDDMRAEYSRLDLGPLVRGKYAARYAKATNIVVIDPALTKAFPNNEAVNDALRSLLNVATAAVGTKARSSRSSQTPRKRAAA